MSRMKSKEQLERREDELAKREYGMNYVDLPGDIKCNIHNAVLEELGLRRKFNFTCSDCGKSFEDEVEGSLVEIFTEIQSEAHTEVLETVCPSCRNKESKEFEL